MSCERCKGKRVINNKPPAWSDHERDLYRQEIKVKSVPISSMCTYCDRRSKDGYVCIHHRTLGL